MAGNLAGSAFPRALRLLAVQQMLSSASFTMQMPTAWPLLQALGGRRAALGIIVGGHPAGGLAAGLLGGHYLHKRGGAEGARKMLLFSAAWLFAGGLSWALAPLAPRGLSAEIFLTLSRVASGVGAGLVVSAGRCWVAESLSAGSPALPRSLATLDASQAAGFVLGPAVAAAAARALHGTQYTLVGRLYVDFTTLPGWMVAGFTLLQVACGMAMSASNGARGAAETSADGTTEASPLLALEDKEEGAVSVGVGGLDAREQSRSLSYGVAACMAAGAAAQCVLCVFETVGVPLLMDEYGWTNAHAASVFGALLSGAAIVGGPSFFVAARAANKVGGKQALMGAIAVMALGQVLLLPWGPGRPSQTCPLGWCARQPMLPFPQFVTAAMIFSMGYAASATLATTTTTRCCGEQSKGRALGLLVACNNFARMTGAAVLGPAYFHGGPRAAFLATLAVTVIAASLLAGFWRNITEPPRQEAGDPEAGQRREGGNT